MKKLCQSTDWRAYWMDTPSVIGPRIRDTFPTQDTGWTPGLVSSDWNMDNMCGTIAKNDPNDPSIGRNVGVYLAFYVC